MKEKLSVKKVYRNAFRYILSHLSAFIFLTVFYFLGSFFSMFIGAVSFKLLMLVYVYLFFYFAAGFYYKQQLLFDKDIFIAAGLRFLTAVVLFLFAIFTSTAAINFGLYFARTSFWGGETAVNLVLGSVFWLIGKYIFIFMLFIAFFIVPSFTFVSEITGKSRSLLNAYAKAKGSFIHIALTSLYAVLLLILAMAALSFANPYIAEAVRSAILVFISITYFKMYDFFYNFPQTKRSKKGNSEPKETVFAQDLVQTENLANGAKSRVKNEKVSNLVKKTQEVSSTEATGGDKNVD